MDKSGWVNIFDAYREKFGEGAPTFGYDDDEWPQMIIDAINSGVPMPRRVMTSPRERIL